MRQQIHTSTIGNTKPRILIRLACRSQYSPSSFGEVGTLGVLILMMLCFFLRDHISGNSRMPAFGCFHSFSCCPGACWCGGDVRSAWQEQKEYHQNCQVLRHQGHDYRLVGLYLFDAQPDRSQWSFRRLLNNLGSL